MPKPSKKEPNPYVLPLDGSMHQSPITRQLGAVIDRRWEESGTHPDGWVFPSNRRGLGHIARLSQYHGLIGGAGGAKFWYHGTRNCFITVAERELMLPSSLTKRLGQPHPAQRHHRRLFRRLDDRATARARTEDRRPDRDADECQGRVSAPSYIPDTGDHDRMTQTSTKRVALHKLTLTKRAVDTLRPGDKPWIAWDDRLTGFGVRVQPSGIKSFIVKPPQRRQKSAQQARRPGPARQDIARTGAADGTAGAR